MPFNEQPCFNCGRLPSEGHTDRCISDYQRPDDGPEEVAPQLRSIAMLDLMRLECSYLNDRPVVFMDDLYKLAKPNVGNDRANQLRDAVCAILSSTGAYPHDIPRLAKEALERDNELLDAAGAVITKPTNPEHDREANRKAAERAQAVWAAGIGRVRP